MSANQLSCCEMVNDSYIPLPKRAQIGSKKWRRSPHLPELQKYIDTIIKVSNECDSDSTSIPEKDTFRKERKCGKYSVYKGYNNKLKCERVRLDTNSSKHKSGSKSGARNQTVSSGDTSPSALITGFEDPRNWKFNKIQSTNFSLKVEKFLKELYPNPYHLDSLNEFHDAKNNPKVAITEGMLSDVVVSPVKNETKQLTNDSVSAVAETNTSNKENTNKNPDPVTPSEKPTKLTETENGKTSEVNTPELIAETVKASPRKKSRHFSNHVTSSLESVASTAESLQSTMKKKSLKLSRKRSSKDIVKEVKLKPSKTFGGKRTDSDIGKLKLLSSTDSEASMSKKVKEVASGSPKIDDYLEPTESTIYKQEDLNDWQKIHEVMSKANRSFLLISEKTQTKGSEKSFKVTDTPVRKGKSIIELIDKDFQIDIKKTKTENQNSALKRDEAKGETEPELDRVDSLKPLVSGLSLLHIDIPNFMNQIECSEEKEVKTVELDSKRSLNCLEQEGKELKTEDKDASQKIDEVLEFMYDCLMRFSSSEELVPEEECNTSVVRRIFSTNQIVQPTTSKFSDETENLFRKKSPQNCQKPSGETNRKRIKTRWRRSEFLLQPESKESEVSEPPTSADGQPALYINPEVNNEIHVPTVETQNELGGYAEVTQDGLASAERLPKTVFPLPGKLNKSKTDARSLKEVLETEEKLLAREFGAKERIECARSKELVCKMSDECRVHETSNISGFKCPSSNFVICVNSLPRNLKTFTAVTPVIAIPQCPPISLINIKDHREMRPMACNSEFSLKQFFAPREPSQHVLTCTYRLKLGSLFEMNKLTVEYIAMPICEKIISGTYELQRENPLKNSECFVSISVKTIKKPHKASKINRSSLTIPNKPALITSAESGIDFESEEKRVEALVEAIEDAEGKFFLLRQVHKSTVNIKSNQDGCCSSAKVIQNETVEHDMNNIDDRKAVHELLVRTYNLQLKLQECLNKITTLHPSLHKCTLGEQDSLSDYNASLNDKATSSDLSVAQSKEKPENCLSMVHWYPVPQNQSRSNKDVIVSKVDHSTSYNPPVEEINPIPEETNEPQPPETEKMFQNDEDDRSSVYSFKSSNDYSETSGLSFSKKESKSLDSLNKKEFFKKIYAEIELIRQNFEAERLSKEAYRSKGFERSQDSEEQQLNSLVQCDAKPAGKTLKTVFKGRESSTELTIGLKDIPMNRVKNISVEKTKLAPNHTKISICISKDSSKELRVRSTHSEILQNKLPAYCYNHLTPSLKGIASTEEDNISKSSQSVNDESEDEDYKSVGSSVEESDTDPEPEKPEPKEQKTVKASPQKNAPKHRFEFYRKMNTNFEDTGVKPRTPSGSVCRYKELEPLKQAMTEMQIRMRSIKRDALYNGNDYYERALKLAKMSAGFCQSCGNRAVIPNDTFGYYKTLIPRRYTSHGFRQYKTPLSADPSFYSFRSSNADVGEHLCDLDIKHSSYLLNRTTHSNRTILRGSLQDMPVLFERM